MKLSIGYLVCWLVLAVVWRVLLDSIIGEMDLSFEVVDIKLITGSAYVSLFEPIGLKDSVYLADHHVVSDIEFPLLIEERSVEI